MTRTEIINSLIRKYDYKSYLEVGVQSGVNFRATEIYYKCGVDPDEKSHASVVMTSDEFFRQTDKTFDIIFIDGLHEADQVLRDIENALRILNEGGIVVCHDMNPLSEIAQRVPREVKVWNGDCWKAWVKLRKRDDLEMRVVDTDHGCGIIRKGNQEPLIFSTEDYNEFNVNRKRLLNLIPVEEFKEIYL